MKTIDLLSRLGSPVAVALTAPLWLGGLALALVLAAGPAANARQEIVIRNASGAPVQPLGAEFEGRRIGFAADAVLLAGGKPSFTETRLVQGRGSEAAALVLRYRPLAGETVEEFRATLPRAESGVGCPYVIVLEASGPRALGCERVGMAALN